MPESLKDKLQADFCSYYKFVTGIEYPWSKKDNTHLGHLIGKMGAVKPGLGSDGIQRELREYFKYCFRRAPQWYRDNCEMPMLNSKFAILYKLWRRIEDDPAEYDKRNQAENYKGDGNKYKNPMHNSEPANVADYINQFIKEPNK